MVTNHYFQNPLRFSGHKIILEDSVTDLKRFIMKFSSKYPCPTPTLILQYEAKFLLMMLISQDIARLGLMALVLQDPGTYPPIILQESRL